MSWIQDQFRGSETPQEKRFLTFIGSVVWSIVLIATGLAILSAIFNIWPVVDVSPAPSQSGTESAVTIASKDTSVGFLWGAFHLSLSKATGLLALSMLFGALGGWVHATRVFVGRVGARTAEATWMWWYAFNIVGGAALALVIYMGIRGGLFASQSATAEVNPYGTAAISAMAGLFSKAALDRLQSAFSGFGSNAKKAPPSPPPSPGDGT